MNNSKHRRYHVSACCPLSCSHVLLICLSLFRFSIFTWDQEHKQKAASSSTGNNNTDLVSFVEFQKHYKSLTM